MEAIIFRPHPRGEYGYVEFNETFTEAFVNILMTIQQKAPQNFAKVCEIIL